MVLATPQLKPSVSLQICLQHDQTYEANFSKRPKSALW
jgi:hypothetical protein